MFDVSFMRVLRPSTLTIVIACAILIVGGLFLPTSSSAAGKALQYDKQGRVIGSTTYSKAPKTNNKHKGSTPNSANPNSSGFGSGSNSGFGSGPSKFNPDTAFEPGEVVILNPPPNFQDKISAKNFRVLEIVSLGNLGMRLARVRTPNTMSVPDAIRALSRVLPGVTIEANTQFDPSGSIQASRTTANPRTKAGWDNLSPTCGKGLVIGQIDASVDLKHPALKNQDITYRAFTKSGRKPATDGHGTAVAAILVGSADWGGLQPGAKLYAANMFEKNEAGKTVGSSIGLLRAVDWMVSLKVHALNLSIAGSDNKIVRKAFEIAKKHNLILIASAGNWGRSDKPAFPAAYSHVLAVTAIKSDGRVYTHANTGSYVDFAEPGVEVYTAAPGGGGKVTSGTSYSAPYVTVMAAILKQAGKAPNVAALRKILSGATQDLGKPGKDNVFGFGKIKARPICKS